MFNEADHSINPSQSKRFLSSDGNQDAKKEYKIDNFLLNLIFSEENQPRQFKNHGENIKLIFIMYVL
jgi:hypothetical protein